MKKISIPLILCILWFVPLLVFAQQKEVNKQAQQMLSKTKSNFFIENKGQWPKEVRYLAQIGGMNAWITNAGVVYDYYKITRDYKQEEIMKLTPYEKEEFERKHTGMKGQIVEMILEGANKDAKILPTGIQDGYYNYFIGNDSTKWASFVRSYNEVLIQDVYPGIDIRYYFDNGLIRYDYISRPGADLTQINLKINGADGYKINEKGELTLKTCLGKITHGKLYAYQQAGNNKAEISCLFIKNNDGNTGVIAENYNPALALVIDPLIYSTFIGGAADEEGKSIALDSSGNAFVTGYTYSGNYPTSTGAYDLSQNGNYDIFVTKLNASGSTLVYSTFIGGNGLDQAFSIAIDAIGNAFVTGQTDSRNYPTTSGSYDTVHNGGYIDIFVTKLNASGSAIVYSTYIGGIGDDWGYSLKLDVSGNAFLTGYTTSANYPTTTGSFDRTQNGYEDAFVTKLNSSGSGLVYSTFIGGSSYERATSISIDSNGNSFITGYTNSIDYPTTAGAYDTSHNGGYDIFVTKLNSSGSALDYSTFIGGGNDDMGNSIAIDGSGNAFITGNSASMNYPTTTGAYHTSYSGGIYPDVFVTKLNTSGSALVYSTFITNAQGEDIGCSIAIDANGNALITGYEEYSSFPTTPGAYDESQNGGYTDAFVTKLNNSGSTLVYSSFIGGNGEDHGYSIAVDESGNVFLTGLTSSTNYPANTGAYNVGYNGGIYDVFVTKILPINQALNVSFTNYSSSSVQCSWPKGGGTKRAVFIKQSATGIAFPINGTDYNANDTLGHGSQIDSSGWYCVYNDTGSTVIIKGLAPNTTYRSMICEYIGSAGNEFYNTDSVTNNPRSCATIYATPSVQASNINFNSITATGFSVSCTKGNGTRRAFFFKSGNSGNAVPVNNTVYTANAAFASGTQIGSSGWYCIYNDTGSTVNVSNLSPNTSYRIMVCEYNGVADSQQYDIDTATANPANQLTDYTIPSTQASNLIFSGTSTTSFTANWTNGNGSNRVVFIKSATTGSAIPAKYLTYNANDTFGVGSQVGSTGWYCVYNGSGSSYAITGLTPNATYRVMVCEYNGTPDRESYNTNTATNNPQIYNPIPATQADNVSTSNVLENSFTISWSNGDGSDRIVFVKIGSNGSAVPINNTNYASNTTFGYGTQIGSTGWYCVYNGTGNSVNVNGLYANTTYQVMVCEYNGTTNNEQYNSDTAVLNPVSQITDYSIPSQASYISLSGISTSSFSASWSNGSGSKRVVFIKSGNSGTVSLSKYTTYTANDTFGEGSQAGTTGWYCVYNGSGYGLTVIGLTPGDVYQVMVCEYNGTPGRENYNTNSAYINPLKYDPIPSTQAQSITFSNYTVNSFTASWTNGNGSARVVFVCIGNSGTASPSNNITYYASSNFGSGTQIGITGWYCVYNGTGSSAGISGLSNNTNYRVMICEYNGTSSHEQYNINTSTTNPRNYYPVPTAQAYDISFSGVTATSMNLSWANGNGSKRAVFILQGNAGTVSPSNYTAYTASNVFTSGTQVGSSGWYCVYDGTGNSVSVSGLTTNTSYRVMVCEYNGVAGEETYNINNATNNPSNQTTDYAVPTTQASGLSFSNVTSTGFDVSWTRGNGSSVILFIYQGTSGYVTPVVNTTYSASGTYGSGSQAGSSGWFCIYNATGTSVSVSGLSPHTTYRIMACEYNGTAGLEKYNTNNTTNNPNNQTSDYAVPATQANNISFSSVTDSSFTVTWTNGNGSARSVFIKAGNSGTASPGINTTYTASTMYGNGMQIGSTGWFCVYNGSGTTVSVTGISAHSDYRLMVCDYNGTTGWEKYNTSTATYNPNNQTTDYAVPSTQAYGISFSNVTATSLRTAWTNGNGTTRAVFIKAATSGSAVPVNNNTYTADTIYSSGSQIGTTGWYCVYNGTGSAVNISGLNPNTSYRLMVCDYNGTGSYEKYKTTTATNNPNNQTTDYAVPTSQAGNISFTVVTDSSFTATWTNGNGSNRSVFIKASTTGTASPVVNTTYSANTRYSTGTQIGTSGWYCVYNGSSNSVSINGLSPHTDYRLMVCDYNGTSGWEKYNTITTTGNPNNQTTDYATPAAQSYAINFSNITSTSFKTSWTNGNGTSRAVFIKATTTGTPSPVNNTSYAADTSFGSGSEAGSGWYCIYNGTGSAVNILGLGPHSTYRLMVCDYNGISGSEKYKIASATNNPNNQTTDYAVPTTQTGNISFTVVTDSSFTATWTNGNGSNRVVFIKASTTGTASPVVNTTYTANTRYSIGTQIGTSGWYCVYNGSSNSVSINGLSPHTDYRLMVCDYNGTSGWEKYNTTTATGNPNNQTTDYATPAAQSYAISFSNITATSFNTSWTNGNGTSRVVFIKASTTGTPAPVNNTSYTADTSFGSGTEAGSGWYCVYNGTGSVVNISGLSPNTAYRMMVCDYNGTSGDEKYKTSTTTNNPNNQTTDYAVPTTQASNITFTTITDSSFTVSWTNGNGTNRAVFVKATTSGTASPTVNTSYTANSRYSVGTQIGTSGWYCIYNGSGTSVSITGLSPTTAYRLMVCDYNGTAGLEKYNTSTATNNPGNQTTDYAIPVVQASDITFTFITATSFTGTWNNGNGSARLVFMKAATSGSPTPVNNTTYSANSTFGSGSQIGASGWYCVYDGTGNSISISGLNPNTPYRVMVCEYNGTAGSEKYSLVTGTNNPNNQTTDFDVPTSQASGIYFSTLTDSSFTASWTNGNGSTRVVFVKAGTTGTAIPVVNTTYSASTRFSTGSQINTSGWYCVYNGTGVTIAVTGLAANTTYRMMVCEYNGTAGWEKYNINTTTNNPNNQTTDYATPDIQASGIIASSVLANSFNLDWNKGNGSRSAVFIKTGMTGSATPDNNTSYTSNPYYGTGSQIRSTGWYCIYNGFDSFASVSGLSPNINYRIMVCEYNGVTGSEKYNTNVETNNPIIVLTDFIAPTIQTFTIQVADNNPDNIQINWSRGNGSYCAGFMKATSNGSALPVNNTAYSADSMFKSGTQIGSSGWYCFYNGNGHDATIYGLSSNKTYRVTICEYNGTHGKEKYNTSNASDNPVNLMTMPAVFNLTGGGSYCTGKLPTGIHIKLDTSETGVSYQLMKNNAPTGVPVSGNNDSLNWNDLTNGTYTVEATNSSGTIVMNGTITVIKNPLPTPELQGLKNEYCFESPVDTLTGIPSGGAFSGNGISTDLFNPSIAGTGKHWIYYVYIDSRGCKNTDSVQTTVHLLTVNVNSPVINCGQQAALHATTTYTGSGSLSYIWSPQSGLNNPSVADPIAKVVDTTQYTVKVESSIGCIANDSGIVYVVPLTASDICLVTVDTSIWKNKIMWEKATPQGNISGYRILKETSLNTYTEIGTVPYTGSPYFIDLSSVPESHADKYKITILDTCGYESLKSSYHKTMNLIISKNGNTMGLSWYAYEDEGGKFIPVKYYIFRGTQPANLQLYDSISSSFTSYNDNNIFSVYYYLVAVKKEGGCQEFRGNTDGWSFSNRKDNKSLLSIKDQNKNNFVSIYPNPFTQSTTISFPNESKQPYNLRIFDLSGKMVRNIQNISESQFVVTKGDLSKGMYYFELVGNEIYRGRFVVE